MADFMDKGVRLSAVESLHVQSLPLTVGEISAVHFGGHAEVSAGLSWLGLPLVSLSLSPSPFPFFYLSSISPSRSANHFVADPFFLPLCRLRRSDARSSSRNMSLLNTPTPLEL